jgi:hypothetical protein
MPQPISRRRSSGLAPAARRASSRWRFKYGESTGTIEVRFERSK